MTVEPGEDAVAVTLHGGCDRLHRREAAAPRPRMPFVEQDLRPRPRSLLVDVLEREAQVIGARRLEIGFRQRSKLRGLFGGEVPLVLEPEIAAALELGSALDLVASNVISASVRFSVTPLMKAPLMSMQTSLMREASELWAST